MNGVVKSTLLVCCMVLSFPAQGLCMGASERCDNPQGRNFSRGEEYSVDPCGQTRGAKLEFKCIASDIYHVEFGKGNTPFCRVEYQSQGDGTGTWDETVGQSKTLRSPVFIKVLDGTIKMTGVYGFH